jgi:hypothetical protein
MGTENERDRPSDLLGITGQTVGQFDSELNELIARGKTQRVMLLAGTESPQRHGHRPYAQTRVEIDFTDESNLRECVRQLRWSDERLRARPEQLLLWSWNLTFRDGMTISFGVNWYDKAFFERRKEAFKEPGHTKFYKLFGATADDFRVTHEVLG